MEQSQVYALYRQLHPVTGIEHCAYCNFIDIHEKHLIVAGTNLLQVYRLSSESDVNQQASVSTVAGTILVCVFGKLKKAQTFADKTLRSYMVDGYVC